MSILHKLLKIIGLIVIFRSKWIESKRGIHWMQRIEINRCQLNIISYSIKQSLPQTNYYRFITYSLKKEKRNCWSFSCHWIYLKCISKNKINKWNKVQMQFSRKEFEKFFELMKFLQKDDIIANEWIVIWYAANHSILTIVTSLLKNCRY